MPSVFVDHIEQQSFVYECVLRKNKTKYARTP
jgi:hypothetical protein